MPFLQAEQARIQRQARVWLKFAEEGVDPKAFVGLSEADVCHIITQGHVAASGTEVRGWTPCCIPSCSDEEITKLASDVMETFVPLKVEYKVKLNLEVSYFNSFRVLDYLFIEACKDFVSVELLKDLETHLNVSTDEAEEILSSFLDTVHQGVLVSARCKANLMHSIQNFIQRPLVATSYGLFDDEVFDVIEIANHERRIRCHGFIGVDDILLGLSFSRVGKCRLVKDEISKDYSPDDPPEMPPFKIYKWAADCAAHFFQDDDGIKPVGLEHLALAVIAVKRGDPTILCNTEYMEGLKEEVKAKDAGADLIEEEEEEVEVWPMADLKYTEVADDKVVKMGVLKYGNKQIQDFKNLIHAIKNGCLELPEMRCQPMDPADSSNIVV